MVERFRSYVFNYVRENLNKGQNIKFDLSDVILVWYGYVLGNIKALYTTSLPDGMYYEITYNKEKGEIYLDAYKRWENRKYNVDFS